MNEQEVRRHITIDVILKTQKIKVEWNASSRGIMPRSKTATPYIDNFDLIYSNYPCN